MKMQYLLLLVVFLACVAALSSAASLYFVRMQFDSHTELLQRIEALEKGAADRLGTLAEYETTQIAGRRESMLQSQIGDLRDQLAVLAERIHKLSQAVQAVPQIPAD